VPPGLPTPALPVITQQPASVAITPGLAVRFTASATGPDLTYRWRRNGQWVASDGRIEGAEGPDLSFSPVMGVDAGTYQFVVSNALGEVASQVVTLTLECLTDYNQDGAVNPDDLSDYIGDYLHGAPNPRLDFNRDGNLDPDDISDYIVAYFFGC
jgi:hypothetical protein